MNKSDIIIFCCHFKRSLFFEETMALFNKQGFNRIWIIETDTTPFGNYQGPCEKYFRAPHFPATCDIALIELSKQLKNVDYKYIFWTDYDLFFTKLNLFEQCLEQFEAERYDHVSRFKVKENMQKYLFMGQIAHVQDCEIRPGDAINDWPNLDPHFASGFEIYSKRYWDSLTDYDLNDHRRMFRKGFQQEFKMGAHKINYGPGEMFWNNEMFHISNLSAYYDMVEQNNFSNLGPIPYHQFRLGYFAAQELYYGSDIYGAIVQKNLQNAYNLLGGKDVCLTEWHKQVKGTCMESWHD